MSLHLTVGIDAVDVSSATAAKTGRGAVVLNVAGVSLVCQQGPKLATHLRKLADLADAAVQTPEDGAA